MGGLGSLETITQEIQRLEHDKVKLTELVQENQVKKESLTLTLEQLKQVLDESKEYMLSKHDDRVKYILSRFIHKIIIGNETVIVHYNYGGFYYDFKRIILSLIHILIRALSELRQSDIITEEEFQNKKMELLNRI